MQKVEDIIKNNESEIFNHFEKHFNVNPNTNQGLSDEDYLCQQLEFLGDYILYADKNKRKAKEQRLRKKEISCGDITQKKKEVNKNTNTLSVTLDDRKNFIELRELGNFLNKIEIMTLLADLKNCRNKNKIRSIKKRVCKAFASIVYEYDEEKIEKVLLLFQHFNKNKSIINSIVNKSRKVFGMVNSNNKKRYYKNLKIELHKDEILLLKSLKGTVYFKNVGFTNTKYDFDNDTGYFDDNGDYIELSENKIELDKPLHIYELIEQYGTLTEQNYGNCDSDINFILYTLEELIERSNLPQSYLDIIIHKIDGWSTKEIADELQLKYGLVMTEKKISQIYCDKIPALLSQTFKDWYEDWLYTYKIKGKWKKCSKCGEVKLATEKYFGKHPDTKDGFYPSCKKCRQI